MIDRSVLQNIVKNYDTSDVSVATIGSHSALDIMDGAKSENFHTLVICQKGREQTYNHYIRIIDDIILRP